MKNGLVRLFGFLLFVFCVCVVTWQLYTGTIKYLDAPIGSKIYTEESEVPVITVCHTAKDRQIYRKYKELGYSDIVEDGRLLPDVPTNMTAEEILEEAQDHYYYLLDFTGCSLVNTLTVS